jgi:hypothetical protein
MGEIRSGGSRMINSEDGNTQDAGPPSLGVTLLVGVTLGVVLLSLKVVLAALR